jgi:hypothetical protein
MFGHTRPALLPFSLLLCSIAGGAAQAQLSPPFIEYAAKFACGPLASDADAVVGQYATSINIHNPQAKLTVGFIKKIVVAKEEGQTPQPPVIKEDKLGPDLAERVDCPVICALLRCATPPPHVEGFVVIEVAPLAGTAVVQPVLDVVGKYSARPRNGEVSSFDVVPYAAQSIKE